MHGGSVGQQVALRHAGTCAGTCAVPCEQVAQMMRESMQAIREGSRRFDVPSAGPLASTKGPALQTCPPSLSVALVTSSPHA